MTDERLEALTERLTRRLKLDDADDDLLAMLENALTDAEAELLLYLNRETLPAAMEPKVLELAVIYARQAMAENPGLRSTSYSEGDTSQSETYLTGAEYQAQADAVLESVAHWRQRVRE